MKKVFAIATMLASTLMANAQGGHGQYDNMEIVRMIGGLIVMSLLMIFILTIMKRFLDHRLKNKIVEKELPENLIASILQSNPHEYRNSNVKWFALLAGIGAGLTIVNYTMPLGIHSLAIMSFSISAAFLGYYFFARYAEK